MLLAQWACETAWGEIWSGSFNLANIRSPSGVGFVTYASLDEFAAACVWVFQNSRPNLNQPLSAQNNYYWPVLEAACCEAQLAALCASAWSAGHYGGSLSAFSIPLEDFELTPQEHAMLQDLHNTLDPSATASGGVGVGNGTWATFLINLDKKVGGTEPTEPVEPTVVTLNIPAQTIKGTLS